jgi:DNA-binding helix-hairpin-helix protein with protein kinase domain
MERSQLGQKLAQGGEGEIFLTADRSLVAKVYHEGKMTPEAEQKLRAMLANPPHDSMRVQGRVSIAWAVDLVTVNGIVKGYAMPLVEKAEDKHLSNPGANVSKCRDLIDFYNPSTRRKNFPWFHYGYLIRTARNIAIVTNSLHSKGYAIGDVNESNILVALDTIVTFVDTDSFQVPGQGKNFRCQVGKPEYTPPELQGVSFKEIDRTQANDLFGLGVLIFQLLMQGQHPFAGKYQGQGETPEIKDRIKAGHFPHGNKQVPYAPIPMAPAFTILPLRLQDLFIQCFETGHNAPDRRPTAEQWNQALREAERELKRCSVNENHLYSKHLPQCCWCELAQKFGGRDPFPAQAEIQGGTQLQKSLALQQPITSIAPQIPTVIHPKTSITTKSSTSSTSSQNTYTPLRLSGNGSRVSLLIAIIAVSGILVFFSISIFNWIQLKSILENKASTVADYDRAISIAPTNVEAYNRRGNVKYKSGNKQGAVSDYSQAILIEPNFAILYYQRGNVKYELGDNQGAVSDYSQAILIEPNFAEAFNNRGFAKNKLGNNQDAIADVERAISLVNSSETYYVNRGAIKYESDKQGAIPDFVRAISINRINLEEAYNLRGVIKYELGDKDGAIADFDRAIYIALNFAEAYNNRAILKSELGDKQGAISDYNKALWIDPNNVTARKNRAVSISK